MHFFSYRHYHDMHHNSYKEVYDNDSHAKGLEILNNYSENKIQQHIKDQNIRQLKIINIKPE